MAIEAKVIADSVANHGGRITTLQLRYPRLIHAELLTHRAFSRNASSSRAIPLAKLIEQVENDPAMPIHWGKNQSGMQAREELDEPTRANCQAMWLEARDEAVRIARAMGAAGLHKQVVNRILEPFSHIEVVLTSTDFSNFFTLRDHPDAQPEMQALAQAMRRAIDGSTPTLLGDDEWHMPYVPTQELLAAVEADPALGEWRCLKFSVARCARVSFLKHDQTKPSQAEDFDLFDRLVGGHPKHASPSEHQASPFDDPTKRSRNFVGWLQYRELVESPE